MPSRQPAAPDQLSRRRFVTLASAFAPVALTGCISTAQQPYEVRAPIHHNAAFLSMYDERPEETFPLPATDISEVETRFLRQEVNYRTNEAPGTIVVDTSARYLYLVRENGRAIRPTVALPFQA